jgi:hypothetical protein
LDATVCPHCLFLEQYGGGQPPPAQLLEKGKEKEYETWKKKLAKEKGHPERIKKQHNSFKTSKDKLANGLLPDTVILLQDFTQLQPQSGFHQDLIITLLKHNKDAEDKIQRKYFHWIANQEKNDLYFVVGVWEYLLSNKLLGNIKHIEIWSDGGNKHFKYSATMYYFSTIKERYNISITYNFYESYHGHNAYDAAASHAKKAILRYQLDKGIPCWDADNLASAINTINHHEASTLAAAYKAGNKGISISSMVGIKSYFMFQFPTTGKAEAYTSSSSSTSSETFTLHGTFVPLTSPTTSSLTTTATTPITPPPPSTSTPTSIISSSSTSTSSTTPSTTPPPTSATTPPPTPPPPTPTLTPSPTTPPPTKVGKTVMRKPRPPKPKAPPKPRAKKAASTKTTTTTPTPTTTPPTPMPPTTTNKK